MFVNRNSPFDICVVGHITKDRIVIEDRPDRVAPGGTAYYAAMTYARLGLATAVVTRLAPADAPALTDALRGAAIAVFTGESVATTTFENVYSRGPMSHRRQRIRSIAAPLQAADLSAVEAAAYHFGPLTAGDMRPALWQGIARHGPPVALDVQGLLRRVVDDTVELRDWPGKVDGLAGVDILKADHDEAATLTGERDSGRAARALASFGPREVLVTRAGRGSVVFADGRACRIPAYTPRPVRDPTGCGDTYLAGYVARRLAGDDPEPAAHFAAAAAGLKSAQAGPFRGTADEAAELCRDASATEG